MRHARQVVSDLVLIHGGELLDFSREEDVLVRDAVGIVRDKVDTNNIEGVRPIRMMVHFFRLQSYGRHEGECLNEVFKLKL